MTAVPEPDTARPDRWWPVLQPRAPGWVTNTATRADTGGTAQLPCSHWKRQNRTFTLRVPMHKHTVGLSRAGQYSSRPASRSPVDNVRTPADLSSWHGGASLRGAALYCADLCALGRAGCSAGAGCGRGRESSWMTLPAVRPFQSPSRDPSQLATVVSRLSVSAAPGVMVARRRLPLKAVSSQAGQVTGGRVMRCEGTSRRAGGDR
jgi:hypothetical protein